MELNPYFGTDIAIQGRHLERLNQTCDFIGDVFLGTVLCVGERSTFDVAVASRFVTDRVDNTNGDLDMEWSAPSVYTTVFCFEIMEHLTNPRLFLHNLKNYITNDSDIYISIPTHLLRRHWKHIHYHEIDRMRMEYLFNITGYDIVDYRVARLYPILSDITGIRPAIRFFSGYSWFISRTDRHYYRVRKLN